MSESIDDIMQRATTALVQMDYLGCETLCLEALARARAAGQWADYARILLPLQEARRQRRMIAAQGVIRLGTSDLLQPATAWLDQVQTGCIVVTHPHTRREAAELHDRARRGRMHVEVLLVDGPSDAATWRLRSFQGPSVACDRPAPPPAWRDRWLPYGDAPADAASPTGPSTPADWFLNAAEALGDAALRQAEVTDVENLESLLQVAPDHEILHQRLAAAARERRSVPGTSA